MVRTVMRCRSVWAAVVVLVVSSAGLGGPIAVVRYSDGTEVKAEVLGFAEGQFHLREVDSGLAVLRAEAEVEVIDFARATAAAKAPKEPAPAPGDEVAMMMRAIQGREFWKVRRWAVRQLRGGRAKEVGRLEGEIRTALGGGKVPRAARRDLMLGMVVLLGAERKGREALGLFQRVRREYPGDAVVRRFGEVWARLARERRPGSREPGRRLRPEVERGPSDGR